MEMEPDAFGESNLVAVFIVKQKSLTKMYVSVGVLSDTPSVTETQNCGKIGSRLTKYQSCKLN